MIYKYNNCTLIFENKFLHEYDAPCECLGMGFVFGGKIIFIHRSNNYFCG